MCFPGFLRNVFPFPTLFVSVCAFVFVSLDARDAQAGCGDYVLVNGRVLHNENSRPFIPGMPKSSFPLKTPCQGPYCSGTPATPAPVPAPLVQHLRVDALQFWAGDESSKLQPEHVSWQRMTSDRISPTVALSGIFRPPR